MIYQKEILKTKCVLTIKANKNIFWIRNLQILCSVASPFSYGVRLTIQSRLQKKNQSRIIKYMTSRDNAYLPFFVSTSHVVIK